MNFLKREKRDVLQPRKSHYQTKVKPIFIVNISKENQRERLGRYKVIIIATYVYTLIYTHTFLGSVFKSKTIIVLNKKSISSKKEQKH